MRRSIRLGIFIVAMTGVSCGAKLSRQEVGDLLWEAERGPNRMDYAEVESTYKKIIRGYADSSYGLEAQKRLVRLYLRSGHPDRAEKACEDLKRYFSEHEGLPLAIAEVAYSYRRDDKRDKALELYRYAIDNWPRSEGSLQSYQDLAALLIEMGREDDAKAIIERLIENFPASPNMVITAVGIAQISRYQGGEDKGRLVYRYVTDIIGSRPEIANEICSRGLTVVFDIVFEGGGGEDAIDNWMSDFKGHPDLAGMLYHVSTAYSYLGGFYERKGMQEKVDECSGKRMAVLERIIGELPRSKTTARAYLIAGIGYKSLGRRDKQLEYHQKVVEFWPHETIACSALYRILRSYGELVRDGEIGREEGAVKLCEISRRIVSDFPDERFYVRAAEGYLERWESTAANYVLLEKSSEAARPGELGGYWEKLTGPATEGGSFGRIAFGQDGVLWVLIDARPHYWDGKGFRAARIEHGADATDDAVPLRSRNADPNKYIDVFWGGNDRPLYISQFGTKRNAKRLYKLAEGKAVYVTDYYDERTEHYGPFWNFYVSKSGTLINWGKNFLAAYVDGKWNRTEMADMVGKVYDQRGDSRIVMARGSGPIADVGGKVYFHCDGRLHWVDGRGNFGNQEGIRPGDNLVIGIPWGDNRLVLRETRPAQVYDTRNWERMPAVEEKMNSLLGSRSILDGFGLSDGSLWLFVNQPGRGSVFAVVSPDCEIRLATETLQLGWTNSPPWGCPQSFIEASDGSLWFATMKNGIARWKDGKVDFFGWKQGYNMGSATELLTGPNGTVYAMCADGVYEYRPDLKGPLPGWVKQWEEHRLASSDMVQDFEGNIWMALKEHPGKVSRWDGQAWAHISIPFDTSIGRRVTVDDRGHLLLRRSKSSYDISLDGAIRYEDDKAMVVAAVADGAKRFHTDGQHQSFVVTEGGKIWFSDRGRKEPYHFNGERWEEIRISEDHIEYMYESLKYGFVFQMEGKEYYSYNNGQIVKVEAPDPSDRPAKPGSLGGGWNNKSGKYLRRFFAGKELECDLRDTPLFGYWRDIQKIFEDRAGNVWIEEIDRSHGDRTVFVKRNTDFRLRAEAVPAEAFRSIEIKVESLVGGSRQEGTRLFWRIGEGQWRGGEVEDSVAIEFPEEGRYDIEIVGMGPVGEVTGNRLKFSVDAAVPSPETILTMERAYECEDVIWEIPAKAEACDGCNPAQMRYRINGGEWKEAYEGRMAVLGGLDAGEYVVEVGAFEDEKYFDATPLKLTVKYEPDYDRIVSNRIDRIIREDREVARKARTEIKMGGAAVFEPLMEEAAEAGRMTRFGRMIERLALEIRRTTGR